MRIRQVAITQSYLNEGHYNCTVTIDGDYGEVCLKIPEERVSQIIDTVADLIVDSARDVAENLKRQALGRTAIEHQP